MLDINLLRRSVAAVTLVAAASALTVTDLRAEEFPTKTINVVTHAGAGGGTDITTRMMMLRGRKSFDQDMLVVSKRGGSGAAALAFVASQPADGYTIMTITQSHIFQILQGKVPLKIEDISGLARATLDPQIVVVPASSEIKTLEELMATSSAAEGGLKWGTTFAGGADHVAIHNFAKAADNMPYTIVPFKGGGDIVTALVGTDVDVALLNYAEGESQFEAGELRAIAVLADERIAALSDVPTAKEQGIDNTAATIRGFATLTSVPPEVRQKLSDGLVAAMEHPIYQGYLETGGMPGSSVVGAEEWNAQMRKIHDESRTALEELGML